MEKIPVVKPLVESDIDQSYKSIDFSIGERRFYVNPTNLLSLTEEDAMGMADSELIGQLEAVSMYRNWASSAAEEARELRERWEDKFSSFWASSWLDARQEALEEFHSNVENKLWTKSAINNVVTKTDIDARVWKVKDKELRGIQAKVHEYGRMERRLRGFRDELQDRGVILLGIAKMRGLGQREVFQKRREN